jgi:2-polyprenyl-6-methoxyphenol hydroxylase-like FAD-dependent oxidoreductase
MPNAETDGMASALQKMKVVIIGAGLGGCATAMAMHYQGFEVVIYEKIRKFARLGDSLGLGENALKLLRRWGMDSIVVCAHYRRGPTNCCHRQQVAYHDHPTMGRWQGTCCTTSDGHGYFHI